MCRLSNTLVGLFNFVTLLLGVLIFWSGKRLHKAAATDCEKIFDEPFLYLGAFLMVISLLGLLGSCCRINCFLWIYLFVTFLLIVAVIIFTIFAFVVTNTKTGDALSHTGFNRLGDYSNWLQKKVTNPKNWDKIKSCLIQGHLCSKLEEKYGHDTLQQFYAEQNLTPLEITCCGPPGNCNFTYVTPTVWDTAGRKMNDSNPSCALWGNEQNVKCFECESCKVGLLDRIRKSWKGLAKLNILVIVFLLLVYTIGCCAYQNNSRRW